MTSCSHMLTLKDFGVVQEPRTEGKGGRDIQNITERDGVVRFRLRIGDTWWDGDGAGGTAGGRPDRQRAECRQLGGAALHRPGETWEYGTTFRISKPFTLWDGALCMITQIIPDRALADPSIPYLPVCTVELTSDHEADVLLLTRDGTKVVRSFTFVPGQWTSVRLRVHVDSRHGALQASVNGDAWKGVTDEPVSRGMSKGYDMKVGFYRHFGDHKTPCDDYVEHMGCYRRRVS